MEPRSALDRAGELDRICGDAVTFDAWYEVAARRLYSYLYGRCGGNVELAEDLTQQAFVRAIHGRGSFDGRADPITWLISIGRNLLVDHLRRLARDERRHLRLVVREINMTTGDADPWRVGDERAEVLAVLDRLPASQRAALILHHVDGLSVRETGVELHRSVSAVESLLSRGREQFRVLYEEQHRG